MQLPLISNPALMMARWKSILDPVLANPMTNMSILENVVLSTGSNSIPHFLQQVQQGWVITDIQGAATVYRNGAFNDTYLYLHASAGVTVNIGVF